MRWDNATPSIHVEDRRAHGGRRIALGGGLGTIVFILIAALFGVNPMALLEQANVPMNVDGRGGFSPPSNLPAPDISTDPQARFVANVLGDTEQTWHEIFRGLGRQYREPTLVMFRDAVDSGCGFASAAVGPFYCPVDGRVFLDLSFFEELERRFKAPGDFAQAYVIAHEVGHHVQNLLGVSDRVRAMQARVSEREANQLSVRLELQADCYAGVWANFAQTQRNRLEEGDMEEGLRAASAIGDDNLQRRARGRVVPDSFTHGSSTQRVRWFKRGYDSGDPNQCDTFSVAEL